MIRFRQKNYKEAVKLIDSSFNFLINNDIVARGHQILDNREEIITNAVGKNKNHHWWKEHEDMLLAIGSLKDGAIVSHLVNWVSPIKERVTSILGENGMLVADTLSINLHFHKNGSNPTSWDGLSLFKGPSEGATFKFELEKNEPLENEHVAFQGAIRTGNIANIASLSSGLEVLKVSDLIIQSSVK
jgi:predicted dehydrogenase